MDPLTGNPPVPHLASVGVAESPPAPAAGSTPPSPLLELAGAVPGTGPDTPVAWHYGDPVREQRLLEAGEAVVDLSHRGVVRVAGPDRLSWLNSLTTQLLTGLAPGESAQTLVLSPHGHIEHDLHLVDDGTACWITLEPGSAAELVAWLGRMRFTLRVEVAEVGTDWAVLGVTSAQMSAEIRARAAALGAVDGTALGAVDEAALPPVWVDPWPRVGPVSAVYTPSDAGEHPGVDRVWHEVPVPRDRLSDIGAGYPLAGSWASEALRVAARRPRFGFETDHRTIPHELDLLRTAVHLQKGCYRGQETVARVHNLGRPPRRLVLLHLDGSENVLPEHGAAVLHGARAVGQVTTAARHHELGPVALAVVKRSTPPDAVLTVDGVPAAQELVVAP